jgi:hypothetical protein
VDDGLYLAVLNVPFEYSGTHALAMAVNIPACNVFLNSRLRFAYLEFVDGECNACASTDSSITLQLASGNPLWTGWGTNYFTIFSNYGVNDTMLASGTLEWAVNEMNKT